jgi:hypothetical protein
VRWLLSLLVCALAARPAAAAFTTHVDVHTPEQRIGSLLLRDVTVSQNGKTTCVRAMLAAARIRACGVIDTSGKDVMLRNGRATITVAARTAGTAKLGKSTLKAKLSGNLSKLDLRVSGTVKTASATLKARLVTARLSEMVLPFSVHVTKTKAGGLDIVEDKPLVVRLAGATLSAAGATIPVSPLITLHPGWPAWSTEVRWVGLDLGPAFPAATKNRMTGTGALAGELTFTGNKTDVALTKGAARARNGTLRLSDPALREKLVAAVAGKVAIQHRIAAALSDFHYDRLDIALVGDPDAKISLTGTGNRVNQDIALTVNVRSSP